MTNPAAARGHQARPQLLAAATELIPELGWSAVSTRILAQRAGVTASVVHYHFASLQALLQEAALAAMGQAVAEIDALVATAETPGAMVDAALASTEPYTGADPMSLLFVEAYLAGSRDEQFGAQIGRLMSECRGRFAQRLRERGLPDPESAAAVVFAALDGLVLHRGLGVGVETAGAAAALRRITDETDEETSQ